MQIGLKISATTGTTTELPKKANKKASPEESALSPQNCVDIAKGIAPLSSTSGIRDIKKVASQTLPPNVLTKNCDIPSVKINSN